MNTTNTGVDAVQNNDEIDLLALAHVLYAGKTLIILLALLFACIAGIYAFGKLNIYKADLSLQIEDSSPNLSGLGGLEMFSAPSKSQVEQQIILSRSVLGEVIKDLHLDISVQPNRIPLPFRALTFFDKKDSIGIAGLFYKMGYAPNSAKAEVSKFIVPIDSVGTSFDLIIDNNKFELNNGDTTLLAGALNQEVSANGYSILVESSNQQQKTHFKISKLNYLELITSLQEDIKASTASKQADGILILNYSSYDPEFAVKVIDRIAEIYIKRNVKHAGVEIAGSLNFLKNKVPRVKQSLEQAEGELNSFRVKNGSVNISSEAQALLDQVVEVEKSLSNLRMNRSNIQQKFTSNHPSYKAWQQQTAELNNRRNNLQHRINNLPKTQQDVVRLNRDVQVNNQIYLQMLQRIQSLDIAYAGTVGNVFLLDSAVAFLQPGKRLLIILIGFVLGAICGAAIILGKYALRRGISGDDELQALGLSVYAVLPYSKEQGLRLARKKEYVAPLSLSHPQDEATESIRSLRTSLHFAMLESKNNIVSITGAEPAVGKSFVSTNLAILIAQTGAKVLLIDADMRRGRLHHSFGISNQTGFSAIISKSADLNTATIRSVGGVESLDVITRGEVPPNPTELLMGKAFPELLTEVSKLYDIVLIDTPPVLAVADAIIIAEYVGTNMLIVRSESTTAQEVRYVLSRFNNAGLTIKGAVLNAFNATNTQYAYNYSYAYGADKK